MSWRPGCCWATAHLELTYLDANLHPQTQLVRGMGSKAEVAYLAGKLSGRFRDARPLPHTLPPSYANTPQTPWRRRGDLTLLKSSRRRPEVVLVSGCGGNSMKAWLLLTAHERGLVHEVRGLEVADGPGDQDPRRLRLGRALVDGQSGGDLALACRAGGEAALRALALRGRRRSLERLAVEMAPLPAGVVGRSSELLFALMTFLHVAEVEESLDTASIRVAATGTILADGTIGPVVHLAAKLEAAIASGIAPAVVFFPRAGGEQPAAELAARCQAAGLDLRAVDDLAEALSRLGVPPVERPAGSPYRALEAFDREHSHAFFGRTAEVAALRDQLLDAGGPRGPTALVIGASGAGKSSFCLAGLVPALEAARPGLRHAVWRPRDAAAHAAEEPIGEPAIVASILASWRREDRNQAGFVVGGQVDGCATADLAGRLPRQGPHAPPFVWVIDQFEELFTLDFEVEAKRNLAALLRTLADRGTWIVATLRNEFYGAYQDLEGADGEPVLTEVFGRASIFDLARMGPGALRQVIAGPAELAGLGFERRDPGGVGLDERLLIDAMAASDALPLLEFVLQALYERREPIARVLDGFDASHRLTFAAYEATGGLQGVIGGIADRVFATLDPSARAALPTLLAALARPSDEGAGDTARPTRVDQWPQAAPVHRLIEALVGCRVLVRDGRTLRVAHEALFTHWPRASGIMLESRQARLARRRLLDAARYWDSAGRPDDMLLTRRSQLALARTQLAAPADGEDLAPLQAFVAASAAARAREAYLVLGAVTAAVVVATAQPLLGDADDRRVFEREAAAAATRGLSPDARLYALAAMPLWGSSAAGDDAAERAGLRLRVVAELGRSSIERTAMSQDGRILVTEGGGGGLDVWDAEQGVRLRTLKGALGLGPSLSADGRRVAAGASHLMVGPNRAGVWDTATGVEMPASRFTADTIGVQVSPDGRLAVVEPLNVVGQPGARPLVVLDAVDGQLRHTLAIGDGVWFSADSRRLVASDGTVWSTETWRPLAVFPRPLDRFAISLDGELVLGVGEADVQLVRPDSGGRAEPLEAPAGTRFVMSEDGAQAIFILDDGRIELWDLQQRRRRAVFTLAGGPGYGAFTPGGTAFVIWPQDGPAGIWDTATGRLLATSVGMDVDYGYVGGGWIALRSAEDGADLWDARRGRRVAALGGPGMVHEVAMAKTGARTFVLSRLDHATILDTSQVLEGRGNDLRRTVCARSGPRLAAFSAQARQDVPQLRGRPWHPCDWRGLDEAEGWSQLIRRMLVRGGLARDYACGETVAFGGLAPRSTRACPRR